MHSEVISEAVFTHFSLHEQAVTLVDKIYLQFFSPFAPTSEYVGGLKVAKLSTSKTSSVKDCLYPFLKASSFLPILTISPT